MERLQMHAHMYARTNMKCLSLCIYVIMCHARVCV